MSSLIEVDVVLISGQQPAAEYERFTGLKHRDELLDERNQLLVRRTGGQGRVTVHS